MGAGARKCCEPLAVLLTVVQVTIRGETMAEPRLTVFLGDKTGLKYTYSHKLNVATVWPEKVLEVKKRIERVEGHSYNVALCNW